MIQLGEAIWLFDGPTVNFYGAPYPTRSIAIRLKSGGLWIWSPTRLSNEVASFVMERGPVEHLVSPNKLHSLFLREWKRAFPKALVWGPDSTIRKCSDLEFQPALGDHAPKAWADEIEQFWFRGCPFLDEVIFFHKASRTAIFADLTQNFSESFLKKNWRPWLRVMAHIAKMTEPFGRAPLELRLTWFHKKADREKLQRLLLLDPEKVVMAHGTWQSRDGRHYLEKAFSWLL